MKSSFFFHLFILVIFSACTGERNIDTEDREDRLGMHDGSSQEPPNEYTPVFQNISMYFPRMLNENIMALNFKANFSYSSYDFPLYFDLKNGKVFSIGKKFEFFEIGQFQCVRLRSFCSSFKFEGALNEIDRITGQLRLPPEIKNSSFSFMYHILPGKYEAFEIINDIPNKIETAPAAELSILANADLTTHRFILFQKRSDHTTYLSYKFDEVSLAFDFQFKLLEEPWIFGKIESNQQGADLRINVTFVNLTDLSTSEKKYLIKNVQD